MGVKSNDFFNAISPLRTHRKLAARARREIIAAIRLRTALQRGKIS